MIASTFAVMACGPAAPAGQDQSSANQATTPEPSKQLRPGDPVPTLAGTPPMIYLHNPEGTLTPAEAPPTRPLTEPVLPQNLEWRAESHAATQQARRSAGQPEEEGEIGAYEIWVDSDERVDEVVKQLEKRSILIMVKGPREFATSPALIAAVPVSMLKEISELEGIVGIREVPQSQPGSGRHRTQPNPSNQNPVRQHGVHFWHPFDSVQNQTQALIPIPGTRPAIITPT